MFLGDSHGRTSQFQWFMNSDVPFGDYFDHVLSWWSHPTDNNVLIVAYEDMKRDLPGNVALIAKFISHDLDQEVIDKIACQTTFKNMQGDPGANYSWAANRRDPNAPPFMRKGEVGDWRNYFTPEQSSQMDARIVERTAATGLDFTYS